jgi:hypothetical protein
MKKNFGGIETKVKKPEKETAKASSVNANDTK